MLRGKKVLLRPIKRSDRDYFLKWYNDLEITQYLGMYLPITEINEEKWIEKISLSQEAVFFVIEAVKGDSQREPIGSCGLTGINSKDRCAIFGIAIGEKDFWENGYGTEAGELLIDYAFMQLNLHRIASGAYEFNGRSRRMHEKLGFVEEGSSRKEIFKNGRYCDKVNFGLLIEEWKDRKEKLKKPTG